MSSCRARGFCPSCHVKRVEEWGERILSWRHIGFNVHGGGGPEFCSGVSFRRTRPQA